MKTIIIFLTISLFFVNTASAFITATSSSFLKNAFPTSTPSFSSSFLGSGQNSNTTNSSAGAGGYGSATFYFGGKVSSSIRCLGEFDRYLVLLDGHGGDGAVGALSQLPLILSVSPFSFAVGGEVMGFALPTVDECRISPKTSLYGRPGVLWLPSLSLDFVFKNFK